MLASSEQIYNLNGVLITALNQFLLSLFRFAAIVSSFAKMMWAQTNWRKTNEQPTGTISYISILIKSSHLLRLLSSQFARFVSDHGAFTFTHLYWVPSTVRLNQDNIFSFGCNITKLYLWFHLSCSNGYGVPHKCWRQSWASALCMVRLPFTSSQHVVDVVYDSWASWCVVASCTCIISMSLCFMSMLMRYCCMYHFDDSRFHLSSYDA